MSHLLEELNPPQAQAVSAPVDKPILVLAGPGSGKTRVLTHRIAWLIQGGIPAGAIMGVTFTNKAAREMRNRIGQLVGEGLGYLRMGTFHAICAAILRREAKHLPLSKNYVIYDSPDQLALIKDIIVSELNLDDKTYRPQRVQGIISQAKNDLITPAAFEPKSYFEEVAARIYTRYQERLLLNDAVDFDDLLMMTALLLRENSTMRGFYQRTYEHVLVDEFQDTNIAQYELVRLLAAPQNNLFCVGDEDQSIYRWRGADYRNVARLREDFPDLVTILLEQNYRSTQSILDAAVSVIDKNPNRVHKKLFTEQAGGIPVVLHEAHDEYAEAAFVVDTIATLVALGDVQPGGCAVMYRTNAQSRTLEDAFIRRNLPYKLVGATRFYGRKEIKDIIAYLRVIHNPEDGVGLARIINTPNRGIGSKTLSTLQVWATRENISLYEALRRLDALPESAPVTGRSASALLAFFGMVEDWRRAVSTISLGDLVRRVVEETKYRDHLNDGTEQGEERWENVKELVNLAADIDDTDLTTFLEEIALISEVDDLPDNANAPTLLTLHAAKGLEFDVVFLVGLEEGILPHSRSKDEAEGMEEERRLMYVGMTRARQQLYLLYTFRRSSWEGSSLNLPSRFLEDIPPHLLNHAGAGGTRAPDYRQVTTWGPTPPRVSQEVEEAGETVLQFRAGMRVRHPSFGEGIVLNSRANGTDEEVSVVFEDVGIKRLMVSFARLIPIEG